MNAGASHAEGRRGATIALEALLLFAIALSIRCIGLGQDPAGDELHHIFYAGVYNRDGVLSVDGGEPYLRARWFTLLIAALFRVFGDSITVARLPAVIAGSLTPVVAFLWLRLERERLAAWVAGLLIATSPVSLILSQQARFYSIQQLCFLIGCIGCYVVLGRARPVAATLALTAGSVAALLSALSLQVISVIGLAGLGIFVVASLAPGVLAWARERRTHVWLLGSAGVVFVAIGVALAGSDVGEMMLSLAQYTDLWARGSAGAWRWYHWNLDDMYPTLWSTFPLLAIVALSVKPRLAALALCVFGVAFVAHSLVAWKAERYLEYAMPFFFVIAGLGVAGVSGTVQRAFTSVIDAHPISQRVPVLGRAATIAVVAVAVVFLLVGNRALLRTAEILSRDPSFTHPGLADGSISWSTATETLAPLVASVDALLTTDDLKALYFLGRVDYIIDKDHMVQEFERPEFDLDPEIRRPMVSRPESIERIIACNPRGLIVAQAWSMRTEYKVPRVTADYIRRHTKTVPLDERLGLEVYRWDAATPRTGRCPEHGIPRAPES